MQTSRSHGSFMREQKPKLRCSFCRKLSHTDSTCRSKGKASKSSKDKVHVITTTVDHQFAFKIDVGNSEKPGARLESLLIDCSATAHIVNDKTKFTRFDESFCPDKRYIELVNGTKSNSIALARGDVTVQIKDASGQTSQSSSKGREGDTLATLQVIACRLHANITSQIHC